MVHPSNEEYHMEKNSISLIWANMLSIVILFVSGVLFAVPYMMQWGGFRFYSGWMWLLYLLFGLIMHEVVHGVTFALLIKDYRFKHIRFGFKWKYLMPFCHCDKPMKKADYVVGALMPLLLLGILPALSGICFHCFEGVLFGIVFSAVAAGDLMVVWKTRKISEESLIMDNPEEVGFIVYEKMV